MQNDSTGNAGIYRLIEARAEHVTEMMRWFTVEDQVRNWAGPGFRFPFDHESFHHDVGWQRLASYVLVADEGDRFLAFGQIYSKLGRIHLARLAVEPMARGRGLGGELIRRLIELGVSSMGNRECSLWVAQDNEVARRCYLREGFVEVAPPEVDERLVGARFMVRPR